MQMFHVMLQVFLVMLHMFPVLLQVFRVMLHVFPVTLHETRATLQETRETLQETRATLHASASAVRVRRIHKLATKKCDVFCLSVFVTLCNDEVCDNGNAMKQYKFQNNYGVIA